MHQFFQRIGQSAKKFYRLFGSVLRHFAPRTFFRHVKNLFGILRQKGFRGLAAHWPAISTRTCGVKTALPIRLC